jgi:CHAD domain-containing protein
MAKAKQVACPDRPSDPQKWLAELLRLRFDEVLNQRGAALDPANVDGVHDMRVATRRLRGALRDFGELTDCPSIKRVRKGLKSLADELGAVRDHDVAIIALEKLKAESESSDVQNGIGLLIDERLVLRDEEYLDLMKVISVTSIEDLQQKFTSAVDKALGQRELFQPTSLQVAGRDVITNRLKDLLELGSSIYEPFNEKALHKLRIASKRLRYAIELFGTCWNGALDAFAEDISKLQSNLGEVHDCDAWIASLGKRLKGENGEAKNEASSDAEAWLLSEFVRKRSKEYREALELWSEWKATDFTVRLSAAISLA